MKVVNVGREYTVHDDSLKTYNELPAQVYRLRFNKFKGFYFESCSDFEIKEPKIYGELRSKVDKTFKGFEISNKNFGVILSGAKGIGKSLFAKLLSRKAVENDLPVIIIDEAYRGIPDVIEDIDQECVVLFDEFDKVFPRNLKDDDGGNVQDMLLSMFDGMSNGKKLSIITCNELNKLSDYLINRPGRFHYHFRFGYPSIDEVELYMKDKLKPEFYDEIDKIKNFATRIDLNYDCLSAIAFEINTGISFGEAIKDLNILNFGEETYNIIMLTKDGNVFNRDHVQLDMFKDKNHSIYLFDSNNRDIINIAFKPSDFVVDPNTSSNVLAGELVVCRPNSYWDDADDYDDFKNISVDKVIAVKPKRSDLHYAF